MRVLGVDCGTERTGFGVIDSDGRDHRLAAAGVIRTSPKLPLASRLQEIAGRLREAVRDFRPEAAAIEEVFYAANVKTTLNLAHVRGVAMLVIAEAGRSDIGMLFHDAGPGEAIESLAAFLALAMQKGQLGNADADLRARQFLALVTAQTNMRLYQSDPAPLDVIEIKQLVKNAVEMFLYGAVR